MHLHVAGAQLPVTRDVTSNVAAIERAIGYAAQVGADILLTPEGALSGYTATFDREVVKAGLSGYATIRFVSSTGTAATWGSTANSCAAARRRLLPRAR